MNNDDRNQLETLFAMLCNFTLTGTGAWRCVYDRPELRERFRLFLEEAEVVQEGLARHLGYPERDIEAYFTKHKA